MEPASATIETGRVRRRHVIYVQGYDPRGLAEYYRMFRTEYRRFCELYGLTGKIGKAATSADRFTTVWPLATAGRGWQIDTTYEFLRWDDIIRQDFARPAWWKIVHALMTFGRTMIWERSLFRVAMTNWRFALFGLYPYVALIAQLVIAAYCGLWAARLTALAIHVAVVPTIVGLAVFAVAFVALLRRTERLTYMLYMFDDIVSHRQYAYRQRPDWEQRFELFAGYLVDAARTSPADELVVVGHSSGSIVAVDVVARALARDPELGRRGPKVALLTVGGNLPIIGLNPRAGWFRDQLARLAIEPAVSWVDFQSRKDVMNFFAFDPIAGHGIDVGAARRNPTVVPVRFREIVKPENYPLFRWRFFQLHFQFLRANQRRGAAYDYFMICCGPFDLMTRATCPDIVLAPFAAKPQIA